jgi:D-glycero-alpha-D-manno-heptose 1-phosphate guanylyltransferase
MEAVILAGGLGTRLGELTRDVPKPMVPVAGRPFLEYLMDYWMEQGVGGFVLSVGYKAGVVRDHFGSAYRGVPVKYSVETEPLGTGGGLLQAIDLCAGGKAVLALNGDTYFAAKLAPLAELQERAEADLVMALFDAASRDRYEGVELDAAGRIAGFVRREEKKLCSLANGGVYVVHPKLAQQAERGKKISLENELLPAWLGQQKKLFGLRVPGAFIDIGTPSDYARAESVLNGKESS